MKYPIILDLESRLLSSTQSKRIELDSEDEEGVILSFQLSDGTSLKEWADSNQKTAKCVFTSDLIFDLNESSEVSVPESLYPRPYIQIQSKIIDESDNRFYSLNIYEISIRIV